MALGAEAIVARLSIVTDMETRQASTKMGKFSAGISRLTGPALVAGGAILALGAKASGAASRLQQSVGAVDTVFGSSSGKIHKWAKQAAGSAGLAASQYGELASTIGAQLKNLGVPMDQVADKTNDLIKMGADLSATYGGTTAEAVQALGSALRGETDPIERYGISIKQATIEAAVGKDKLKKMTDTQKTAAKTTALLGLVTKQAGGAVGAFGRESDTAAGQQQRATAAWENASATLGTALLPALTAGATALAAMAGWVERNQTLVMLLVGVVAALATGILALNVAVKAYTLYTQVAAIASRAAWISALGPIGLIIAAVIAIVAAVVLLYKKVAWFRNAVNAVWRAIRAAALAVWKAITTAGRFMITALTAYVRGWFAVWRAVISGALNVARAVFAKIRDVVASVVSAIKGYVRSITDVVRAVLGWIDDKWRQIWQKLPGPVQSAMRAATAPVRALGDAVADVVGWVQSLINWIGRIKWPSPPKWLSKIPGVGSLAVTAAPAATVAARGPRVAGLTGAPRVATSGGGGVTIVVQGALDPVAVAAQIRRLLGRDDRRRGVVVAGRSALAAGAV